MASNDQVGEPDVVMACCGDTPRWRFWRGLHLREHLPDLKIRVINVVDLMKLQSSSEHRTGSAKRTTIRFSPKTSTLSLVFMDTRGWYTANLPPDQLQPARPGLQGRGTITTPLT